MPTTVYKYVNTDVTPGGDGSEGNPYASLNEALDANPRNLVAADEIAEFICSGTADDTIAPSISGTYVCDSTRKIIIRAAANHNGVWNSSVYRINFASLGSVGVSINNNTNIHIVEFWGIQFTCMPQNSASSSRHFYESVTSSVIAGTIYRWIKCIMRQVNNASYTADTCRFFRGNDADCGIRLNSCIMYGWQGTAISLSVSPSASIFNVTFVDCTVTAVSGTGGGPNVRNCIIKGCGGTGLNWNATSNYNSTDLTTVTANFGANSRITQTFTFVDEASKDYHLAASDTGARGFGEDMTASSTTIEDIDSVARTGTWDIGADQYVASASGGGRPLAGNLTRGVERGTL